MSNSNISFELINNILSEKNNYGKNNMGENKKVNLEIINTKKEISLNDIITLVYIDNLARIMKYCNYEVVKEYYIDNTEDNIINDLKNKIDYYRINIDIYSTKKELEDNYIIEDFLTKLKSENNCYIEENKLLLKSKDKVILIDNDGIYSKECFDLTHIYTKISKNYNKILIFNNKNNNIYIEELESILNIPNKTIKIINSNLNNEKKYEELDINKFRFNCLTNNLNYHISEEELKNITIISSKIDNYIRINKKNITNFDKNNILNNNITYNILHKEAEFEKNIALSCEEKNPTIILEYIIELTRLTKELINEKIISNEIIELLNSVQIIINNSLKLIGIIPRDEI